jgi:hypothetical protein
VGVIAQQRRLPKLGTAFAAALVVFGATACSSGSDGLGDADAGTTLRDDSTAQTGSGSTLAPSVAEAPGTDPTAPDATVAPTPSADAAVVVPAALQFTAPLVGGGEFDGADVADKPTVFWFWAPT